MLKPIMSTSGNSLNSHPLSALTGWVLLGTLMASSAAEAASITGIQSTQLSADTARVIINFDQQTQSPESFRLQNPPRIALDFTGVDSKLPGRKLRLDNPLATLVRTASTQSTTRLVIDLTNEHQYQLHRRDRQLWVDIQRQGAAGVMASKHQHPRQQTSTEPMRTAAVRAFEQALPQGSHTFDHQADKPDFSQPVPALIQRQAPPPPGFSTPKHELSGDHPYALNDLDFQRTGDGTGQIKLTLSDPTLPVSLRQEGARIVLEMRDTAVSRALIRRMDVTDFATTVKFIDTTYKNGMTRVVMIPSSSRYEHAVYQTDNHFTLEIKPPEKAKTPQPVTVKKKTYRGDKLSLNFQDIEVRSVLQLLADFTGLNIVVADTVEGNLTLRLKNVPWDQALDIILQAKSLDKRRNGDIIYVGLAEEIAERETAELQSQVKKVELAPLRTEFMPINYAKAADIAKLLSENRGISEDGHSRSVLSARGSATLDQRTNTLLVTETAEKLEEVRQLVAKLDIPVRQVLIESRVVIANDDFNKELGVRMGVRAVETTNDNRSTILSSNLNNNAALSESLNAGEPLALDNQNFNVNLPTSVRTGSVALTLLKLPFGSLLDMELSAMQAEGKGEVISSPRIVTANQKEAYIEQGIEIPYQEESASGGTTVKFRKAVLGLKVTPQITPDDRVIMDLTINKDSVGEAVDGVPSIDTRELNTQVLVKNGETVVLGGVYEQVVRDEVNKIPFFADLPFVGRLFRSTVRENDKTELLVFVTPKVVRDQELR